jgi:hypothetical protein
MTIRYYPIIVVASTGLKIRFKLVYSPEEYAAFCSRYVKPDTVLTVIKTLESLYLEKMTAATGRK